MSNINKAQVGYIYHLVKKLQLRVKDVLDECDIARDDLDDLTGEEASTVIEYLKTQEYGT